MNTFVRRLWLVVSLALLAPATWAQTTPSNGLLGFPELPADATPRGSVAVTWFGVATLLFDDGSTKFLIDGFFSRPSSVDLNALVAPDTGTIERMIGSAGLNELAAITPVHSHFDHAMDLGVIAKSTGAMVIGSSSTANIARGAGVPESRIAVIDKQGEFTFGAFKVTLIKSRHAPIVNDGPPFPGSIDAPLVPPAKITDWKEGGSYTVVVAHPSGTALVQGSAGYVQDRLRGVHADVVMLGIGGLDRLGKEYTQRYFAEIVGPTGARCVLPVHWDDFSKPFGTIEYNGTPDSLAWVRELATEGGRTIGLATLPFSKAVNLYAAACGNADARPAPPTQLTPQSD